MKRYDTYKDSGVQWIGEIPSHWKEYRMKYLLSRSSAGVWGDDEKEDENDIVCFRIADFDYAHGVLKFDNITYRNIQKNQLVGRMLSHGDLLIEKSGGGEATPVGRVVRYNYDGKATCSNFIHSISIKEVFSSNFLYYFFYSLYANKVNLLYFNQTTGIQNLKVGDYLSQSIFLPSKSEQLAIAEWLDVKCGEIDKLIATQQRRIDLLQELRQSIITRAVTQGINPDAPLRDSGIDWIGQIPTHWEIRRIKSICKSEKYSIKTGPFGSQLKGQDLMRDGDVRVYNQRNVIDNDFDDIHFFVTKEKATELDSFYTQPQDLLITSRGTIGKCSILPADVPMGLLHPCLIALRINQAICDLDWAHIFISSSSCFSTNIFLNSNATTIEVIYTDTLKNVSMPLPPLSEQREIVAHIERETAKVDHALQQADRQIELLQELRQSVITEVVTGKRKVC